MSAALIELLPDLVFLMRGDGSIVARMGGHSVPDLRRTGEDPGDNFASSWSPTTAALIKRLLRKSIASRAPVEARFQEQGRSYDVRITPQGPNRAIGVVRAALADALADTDGSPDEPRWLGLDRRSFLRRLSESLSMAALREQPIAVAVLHMDGISHIARTMGARVSEEVMSAALAKISAQLGADDSKWYLGQLSENVLAVVTDTTDREAIGARLADICANLREPIPNGDIDFKLQPYAGVGLFGVDATAAEALLEHARTAAAEARRALSEKIYFYSDAMQVRSLSRLDLGRELRDAIANRDIRFRYVGRHDLSTGRKVASVGYLRWQHPMRGEIRPAEFLRIAITTGLALELSRMALEVLAEDFAAQANRWQPDERISFGALRDHIFHNGFVADIERLLDSHALPPERLELRIAEKAFVARETAALRALQKRGVQLIVDEVGRGMSSLASLTSAPIAGLQLDRAWVTALRTDPAASKVCRAVTSIANSFDLLPIAAGIDDQSQRDALLAMGCRYGSGDFFPST
jgi:predicted signal transduction protein with EAL and GGDEF domain